MKRSLFALLLIVSIFTLAFSENYITSFSAAVKNWNDFKIPEAISLVNLSLSSTFNVAYAPDLWYFKTRLELMNGEIKEAKKSLEMAASVFHPKFVYTLLNSLTNASVTSFSPITNVNYLNSIKGFYGEEVFYSPISVASRRESYYVLDGANRFVEKFGLIQKRYFLGVNSTPTAMIYSYRLDSFFISFENGYIYKYSPDFSQKSVFVKGLSYPIVSFSDNFGRVYVINSGKDEVNVFECNGQLFRDFNFFNKKVHILGNVRENAGTMFVMDYTTRSVRTFDITNGEELSRIPFPDGLTPTSFEILGSSVIFIGSQKLNVGGIKFPLEDSKSVFSSSLTERILMTTDIESNKVNLYEMKTSSNIFMPLIDNLSFSNGKITIEFRILDPLGSKIENPGKVVVNDNGFTKPITLTTIEFPISLHRLQNVSDILKMKRNKRNFVVVYASTLKGHVRGMFAPALFKNTTFYIIEDITPTKLEKTLVRLTNGDFISQQEANNFEEILPNMHAFEFKASYNSILPNGVDEIDLTYGANAKYVDSVYYTFQNVMK